MRRLMTVMFVLCIGCILAGCGKQCEHQMYVTVTKEATCQSAGIQTYICRNCETQFVVETPTTEHEFTEVVTREATCSEKGILTHTCRICGASEEEEITEGEHAFDLFSVDPSMCTLCGQTVEGAGVDSSANNPWYGKKWVAVGTSLTSEEKGKFVEPLALRSGLEATNLGIPGATANAQILQIVQTTETLADADLVTVEFGVNDWFEGVPLGTTGDTVPYLYTDDQWNNGGTEEGSFAGACYQIFKTLQEKAPNAVVIFLSETTGQTNAATGENCERERMNYLGLRQQDYTEMAMAVARYMGIGVIDAGSVSMINEEHGQYLIDQIHHSELGGKQYALTVWLELRNIAPLLKAE